MKALFGIILFLADVFAIAMIWNSNEDMTRKILWILGVALFPVIGFAAWWFLGPNNPYRK